MNDLVIVVAGKDDESAIKGILTRQDSLAIRAIDTKILIHPGRDSGCLKGGHDLLRPLSRLYAHGLIVLDRDGCGREARTREQLETEIEDHLRRCGLERSCRRDRDRSRAGDLDLERLATRPQGPGMGV